MAELFDMKEIEERVILIAVSTDDEDDTRASLDELEELVKTASIRAPTLEKERLTKCGNGSGSLRQPV